MADIKRILVVSRMAAYSRNAVHYAISLAKRYHAELYCLHCTRNPFELKRPPSVPVWVLSEDYKKLITKNREEIDAIIRMEKEKGMRIVELIRELDPVEVVLEAVRNEEIDLLIMAAHEEGRLEHLLFGRSIEEIIRKMPCSILLVKSDDQFQQQL